MRIALLVGVGLALGACRSAPAPLPPRLAAPDAYARGAVKELRQALVLNDQDFVYTIAFSPDSTRVAFTRLGGTGFLLTAWSLEPPRKLFTARVNEQAFDVEAVAFSPDGGTVCAASRDGALRCYAAEDGKPRGGYSAKEPLVSLAFHPSGEAVVLGGAGGTVTVLSWPALELQARAALHTDEVRSVAVTRDGRVFTGGWDKSIAVSGWVERDGRLGLEEQARLRFGAYVNDFTVDREGRALGVAFSEEKAERTPEVYQREKRGEPAPKYENDFSAIVDARTGQELSAWRAHRGVVSTAAISPDGQSLVTGGWDNTVYLFNAGSPGFRARQELGWSIRRTRFSEDGRLLAVGAWTPQNAVGDQRSAPAAVIDVTGAGAETRETQ